MFPHKNRDYVDVGGHIGTTVMSFLKIFRNCVAFEPTRENYNFLVKNVNANNMESRCILKNVRNTQMHNSANSGCFYFEESTTDTQSKHSNTDYRLYQN